MKILKSIFYVNVDKINIPRGIRQGLLMLVPMLIGYFLNQMPLALLAAIGTFAHIYVFSGTFSSRLRAVSYATLGLTLSMVLGTLTSGIPLLFGLVLLILTVVTYYTFSCLNIPGPSSTFFIIAFGMSSVMPYDPGLWWLRGGLVLGGGLLGIILVLIEALLQKTRPENQAVIDDYKTLQELIGSFNDQVEFNNKSKKTVAKLLNSSYLLTSTNVSLQKKSSDYQRLVLLHHAAEGLYSELLELNAKGHRPIPNVLVELVDHVCKLCEDPNYNQKWTKEVDVDEKFRGVVDRIFSVDEILHAPKSQISSKISIRTPLYSRRLLQNLSPESMVFMSTLKYTVILGIAIFIALIFDFERAYWIPLTVHTVLLGGTSFASLERALSRSLGTFLGVLFLSSVLIFHPPLIFLVLLMALTGAITEALIASNYAFSMISITTQVLLLAGLAKGHLTIAIAFPRLMDVFIGVVISLICILIIGGKEASYKLPEVIAEVTRIEARYFHYLFSSNAYTIDEKRDVDIFKLNLNISNMNLMYDTALGEFFSNRKKTQYYYPAMFLLQQISFTIAKGIIDKRSVEIDDEAMGQYLLAFENVAKHFERGAPHSHVIDLPDLPKYAHIKTALMSLQEIKLYENNNKRNPNLLKY
ncbi:FUSC family protein [Staphylococcus massiliensis]|uniref:FUSC family protein n=1 Tax=Staphylococcus massiliensis TaxID=555791 RepID=UPI001EDEFCB1|nr:FUSC family protein [Staphylococcus massiliensis]